MAALGGTASQSKKEAEGEAPLAVGSGQPGSSAAASGCYRRNSSFSCCAPCKSVAASAAGARQRRRTEQPYNCARGTAPQHPVHRASTSGRGACRSAPTACRMSPSVRGPQGSCLAGGTASVYEQVHWMGTSVARRARHGRCRGASGR